MSKRGVAPYIAEARTAGKSNHEIKTELIAAGWHADIIDKALKDEPARYRPNSSKPSHFTNYSDWYTKRSFIFGVLGFFLLLLVLATFA